MSELMKKQPTELYAEICLRIPASEKIKTQRIIKNMLKLANIEYDIINDMTSSNDTLSLEEVFPNLHPGSAIRGLRYREGMTQEQLAQKIGIPRRHISEMENGKRSIGKVMAKRLSKALNTVEKIFIMN